MTTRYSPVGDVLHWNQHFGKLKCIVVTYDVVYVHLRQA